MKIKTLSLFSLFIIVFSVFSVFSSVNGQTYYNWIENSSFGVSANYCEDGSFESGAFNSGVTYGNWSYTGAAYWTFSTDESYVGTYSIKSTSYLSQLWYNLTVPILGADIDSITYWAYASEDRLEVLSCRIYYTDDTYDEFSDYCSSLATWLQFDATSEINTAKTVEALRFKITDDGDYFVDSVEISVVGGVAQDTINVNSQPWYSGQTPQNNFGEINTIQGYTDAYSCQMSGVNFNQFLGQDIGYCQASVIEYIDCYLKSADVSDGDGLKATVLYSDRTTDSRIKYVSGNGSDWEYVNFGVNWIDVNKYVVALWIFPVSDSSSYDFLIDDVGLWCSVSSTFTRFEFSVSPNVISESDYSFSAYTQTTYSMNCIFYNGTDYGLDQNGTVTITSSIGQTVITMVNSVFNFTITPRSFTATPYTLESIGVYIVTDSETFLTTISVYWYPSDSSSGGGGIDTDSVDGDFMTNWVVIAIVLLMPSLIFASIGSQINSSMGMISFVGGLTIMGGVSLSIGLINIWFMFAILIVDILIILGMLKGGSSHG